MEQMAMIWYNTDSKETKRKLNMTNFIGNIPALIDNQNLYLALIDGEVMVKTGINEDGTYDSSTVKIETIQQWSNFYKEHGEIILRKATGDDLWYFSTEALDEFENATGVDLELL